MKNDPAAPTNPMRFTGEYFDSATSLYHLRARQYDMGTGRFLTQDPIASPITNPYVAAYVYANNIPTVRVDPSGLWSIGFCLNIVIAEGCVEFSSSIELGATGSLGWTGSLSAQARASNANCISELGGGFVGLAGGYGGASGSVEWSPSEVNGHHVVVISGGPGVAFGPPEGPVTGMISNTWTASLGSCDVTPPQK